MRCVELNQEAILKRIEDQQLKLWWVAEQAGVHKTTLRRWLSRRIRTVRRVHSLRLAEVLGAEERAIVVSDDAQTLVSCS